MGLQDTGDFNDCVEVVNNDCAEIVFENGLPGWIRCITQGDRRILILVSNTEKDGLARTENRLPEGIKGRVPR